MPSAVGNWVNQVPDALHASQRVEASKWVNPLSDTGCPNGEQSPDPPADIAVGRRPEMSRVMAEEQRARGFGGPSSGVWCGDASPGMVARLARLGFDWLCLDPQHGLYSRTEIIDAARSFPSGFAQLVVRVPSCDFVAIGAALDAGARAVIVPQIESAADAQRAVAATFYPPVGGRSWGSWAASGGRNTDGRGGQQQYHVHGDD